ncbi:MAG: hypothetical protein RLZZ524_930 [Pseudomonadota bacterium]|jgi:hypothetical protein
MAAETKIRLTGDATDYVKEAGRAEKATKKVAESAGEINKHYNNQLVSLAKSVASLTAAGAAARALGQAMATNVSTAATMAAERGGQVLTVEEAVAQTKGTKLDPGAVSALVENAGAVGQANMAQFLAGAVKAGGRKLTMPALQELAAAYSGGGFGQDELLKRAERGQGITREERSARVGSLSVEARREIANRIADTEAVRVRRRDVGTLDQARAEQRIMEERDRGVGVLRRAGEALPVVGAIATGLRLSNDYLAAISESVKVKPVGVPMISPAKGEP